MHSKIPWGPFKLLLFRPHLRPTQSGFLGTVFQDPSDSNVQKRWRLPHWQVDTASCLGDLPLHYQVVGDASDSAVLHIGRHGPSLSYPGRATFNVGRRWFPGQDEGHGYPWQRGDIRHLGKGEVERSWPRSNMGFLQVDAASTRLLGRPPPG